MKIRNQEKKMKLDLAKKIHSKTASLSVADILLAITIAIYTALTMMEMKKSVFQFLQSIVDL